MSEHASYPSESDRHNFYRAYLETSKGRPARADELAELDRGVEVWRPAGSARWALWGVISAESQIEALERRDADWTPDWEYLVRVCVSAAARFVLEADPPPSPASSDAAKLARPDCLGSSMRSSV